MSDSSKVARVAVLHSTSLKCQKKKRSFRMHRVLHTKRPLNYCVLSFQNFSLFSGVAEKGYEKAGPFLKARHDFGGDTWFESIFNRKTASADLRK